MRRIILIAGFCAWAAALVLFWLHFRTSRYDYIVGQAAARNGVDFHLVKALIYEESWFRSGIRGSAGELGLMQITRAAGLDYCLHKGFPPLGDEELLEPELNVEIGCWYLKYSLDHYKNTPNPTLFGLLRYNAGESRANNWLRLALASNPPPGVSMEDHYLSQVNFPKTRSYVRRILKRSRSRRYWF